MVDAYRCLRCGKNPTEIIFTSEAAHCAFCYGDVAIIEEGLKCPKCHSNIPINRTYIDTFFYFHTNIKREYCKCLKCGYFLYIKRDIV